MYIRENLLRSRWIPSYRIDIYFAATYRTQETAADCETLVTLLYFFYLPFYTNQSPFTLCSSSVLRFIEFVVKTYLVQMRRQYRKFVDIFCLVYITRVSALYNYKKITDSCIHILMTKVIVYILRYESTVKVKYERIQILFT